MAQPTFFTKPPATALADVAALAKAQLIDPDSARIEWSEEPKPSEMGKGSEAVSGYLVNFTVNARNRFGAYTGKQKHSVLIRDGEVIKSMGFGY